MNIEEFKYHVNEEKRGFKDRYKLEPNVIFVNENQYQLMIADAKNIVKQKVADIQSSDLEMAIKEISFYKLMRIIILHQIVKPSVGYVEFKDTGLAIHIENENQSR